MQTLLITGSNRGIGLELCRQYAENGWQVHACCRFPDDASDLSLLAEKYEQLKIHQLDVTNHDQINALASKLQGVAIDILFNNAGIYGPYDARFGNTDEKQWLDCFCINTIAPLKVLEAFVSHVAASQLKTVATMSSKMASMADNGSGGNYLYRSSKSAVNSVMTSAAIDLKPQGIKVAILHPGWVKTDMGGDNAEITSPTSVSHLRQILEQLTLKSSGQFFDIDGSIIPW